MQSLYLNVKIAMPLHLIIIVHFHLYLESTVHRELVQGPPIVNSCSVLLCRVHVHQGALGAHLEPLPLVNLNICL